MSKPTFFTTAAALEAFDLFTRTADETMATAVLFGEPGAGRTAVLGEYVLRMGEGRAAVVPCAPALGPVAFLQAILDHTGGGFARHGRDGVEKVLFRLQESGLELLLLDDAHRLYKPCLEILEELQKRSGVSLLLSGPEKELVRRLRRAPALRARVGRLRWLRELEREEVEELLAAAGDLRLPRSGAEQLVDELWEASQGNWSRLVRLVTRCREQAALRFRPRLDHSIVDRASGDLGFKAA